MSHSRYPLSFKKKVVREILETGHQSKVAEKYGISHCSASTWTKKFKDEILNESKKTKNKNLTEYDKILSEIKILKKLVIKQALQLQLLKNSIES